MQVLIIERDRLSRHLEGLLDEIDTVGDCRLNAVKLRNFLAGHDQKFSCKELTAIGAYLETVKIQIGDLFDKPDLIKDLSRCGAVYYLVGAKLTEHSRYISQSDSISTETLHKLVDPTRPGGVLERTLYSSVMNSSELVTVRAGRTQEQTPLDAVRSEDWYSLLDAPGAPSLVAIGSPRANHATEVLLSMMFGCTPFVAYNASAPHRLPFHFCWNIPTIFSDLPSNFCVTDRQARSSALYLGGRRHSVDQVGKHDEFGIIAAQRRPSGQILLVVAGLSGVATVAAARMVERFAVDVPLAGTADDDQPLSVAWAAIRAAVHVRDSGLRQETKTLTEDITFLKGPQLWRSDDP